MILFWGISAEVACAQAIPARLAASSGPRLSAKATSWGVVTAEIAPGPSSGAARASADHDRLYRRLLRGLESRLTIWKTPSGRLVHAAHCRYAEDGCRARIAIFARWLAEAASDNGIDPFLLAAIAVKESGLNPFAEGATGERGIVQLHPRGVGRKAEFVRNERFRERCEHQPGACQKEVLELGADLLARAIRHCGSIESGLGMYNSGKCHETDYSTRVLKERDAIVAVAR